MRTLGKTDWIFTDPHFNHQNLVKWNDRPDGYEAIINSNWKLRVGKNDVVYCLGDVCFKAQAECHAQYIQSNPGYKVLILGNHDRQKVDWYLSHGWDEVHDMLMLKATVNGRNTRLLLSHIPQKDVGHFDMNVHGHFHANLHRIDDEVRAMLTKKHKLLSLEAVNYDFVLLEDLIHGRIAQPMLDQLNEEVAVVGDAEMSDIVTASKNISKIS